MQVEEIAMVERSRRLRRHLLRDVSVEEVSFVETPVEEVQVQQAPVEEAHSAPVEWMVKEPEVAEEAHHEEEQTPQEEVGTRYEEVQTEEITEILPAEETYVETSHAAETHTDTAQPAEQSVMEEPVAPEAVVEEPVVEEPGAPEPVASEPELVFQSYHTIDYFASQGIKLSLEENQNPSDRLGRQMKSFTEWLKVMKRLPQKTVEAGELAPDIIGEHKIQAIAAHSVEGREPVTETMAEVLAKQGMLQKAADVYHKLSLLNPDKSSYFAAKIGEIQSRFNQAEPDN